MSNSKEKDHMLKDVLSDNKSDILRVVIISVIAAGALFASHSFGVINLYSDVSNFCQIVTTIIAGAAWYNTMKILSKKRALRVKVNNNDLILIISLARRIENDVREYVSKSDLFQPLNRLMVTEGALDFPDHKYMNLELVDNLDGAICISKNTDMEVSEQAIGEYLEEFRNCVKCVSKMADDNNSIGKIHVFFSGPAEMVAYLMPYFVNKKEVAMYRYDMHSQSYISIGLVEER